MLTWLFRPHPGLACAAHSRSRPAIGVAANQASKVVRVAGIAEGWRHVFVVTRRRCPFVAPTWSEVETRGRVGGEVMPRPGVMHRLRRHVRVGKRRAAHGGKCKHRYGENGSSEHGAVS